jgi:hypothetical protein
MPGFSSGRASIATHLVTKRALVRWVGGSGLGALGLGTLGLGALGLGAPGLGCAAAEGDALSANSLGLPPWQGDDRRLFADELDPASLGLMASGSPRKDQALWLRAQKAEIIARVQIRTFTVESTRGGTYRLGLLVVQALAESALQDTKIDVSVDPGDPAYGLVKAQDRLIKERPYIGFFKRFAGPDDEIVFHFYLTADSAEVVQVVQEALALKDVNR